jgi:hypothetical protein
MLAVHHIQSLGPHFQGFKQLNKHFLLSHFIVLVVNNHSLHFKNLLGSGTADIAVLMSSLVFASTIDCL